MRLAALRVLLVLAFRSLYTHKVKNFIVGGIMFFGTLLVVVGLALLDSVESSMQRSITSSIAGHAQAYDKKAKDELALFGGGFMGSEDVGRIPSFAALKGALREDPDVKAVVPMGMDLALMSRGNELDRLAANLRKALSDGDTARAESLKAQIVEIGQLLEKEYQANLLLSSEVDKINENLTDLAQLRSPEFWLGMSTRPELTVQFIETHIAPLLQDGRLVYMRYLGTDLDLFAKNFDTFEVVSGEMVPTGKRGLLLNQLFYEQWVKNKVARLLDEVKKAREAGKTIKEDALVAAQARQIPGQYSRIVYQLDPEETKHLSAEISKLIPDAKGSIADQLKSLLTVDDESFDQRYAYFYKHVAPLIDLYEFKVGDVITLQSYTKAGYVKSVNLKLYGIFRFKGLERSELAGGHNLIDIMSFRDLYGFLTEKKKQEIAEIRANAGVKELAAKDSAAAEAELFGSATELEAKSEQSGFDEFADAEENLGQDVKEKQEETFDQKAVDEGVALNAAIIFKSSEDLKTKIAHVEELFSKAGLALKVVDWQKASGIVGQFIVMIRIVLYIAISIIFLVALVIINNSMIMATMERVTEIGTMRAIGARRRFVLTLFLLETIALGLMSGGAGALGGAGVVAWIGKVGIPAQSDVMVFLFAGPRLYPQFGAEHLVFGIMTIVLVSIASTLYPARLATTIQPVVAMRGRE
ncbi:MAG: FtsX-like permease family protein [Deltaproteobacteria bacterium]|nr:FtsX-like permease family protein [Deltaproteobacteria bacterium]